MDAQIISWLLPFVDWKSLFSSIAYPNEGAIVFRSMPQMPMKKDVLDMFAKRFGRDAVMQHILADKQICLPEEWVSCYVEQT